MEIMKNLILLTILLAIGYFTYQYFIIPWLDDFAPAESTTIEYWPTIPDECRVKAKILEDAIYDRELGKISTVLLDQYTMRFQTCLNDAGFSDSDAYETYIKIKEHAEHSPK